MFAVGKAWGLFQWNDFLGLKRAKLMEDPEVMFCSKANFLEMPWALTGVPIGCAVSLKISELALLAVGC